MPGNSFRDIDPARRAVIVCKKAPTERNEALAGEAGEQSGNFSREFFIWGVALSISLTDPASIDSGITFRAGDPCLTSMTPRVSSSNVLQAFAKTSVPLGTGALSLQGGRQEISFGTERLLGTRYGPHVPLSFDGGLVRWQDPDAAAGHPYTSAFSAGCRRMLISDVSVRWTGHFAAISISLSRCSALNAPVRSTSTSILSSMPSFPSHSSQSFA